MIDYRHIGTFYGILIGVSFGVWQWSLSAGFFAGLITYICIVMNLGDD